MCDCPNAFDDAYLCPGGSHEAIVVLTFLTLHVSGCCAHGRIMTRERSKLACWLGFLLTPGGVQFLSWTFGTYF